MKKKTVLYSTYPSEYLESQDAQTTTLFAGFLDRTGLYSAANDPQTGNDPQIGWTTNDPEPDVDRK